MAAVDITQGNPRDPAARVLLEASHRLMQSLFPAESNHYLSVEALCAPEVQFYIASIADQTIGCVALVQKTGYAEIKSMFVDPAHRGNAIGKQLLGHLEIEARALGVSPLRLETGGLLKTAHQLYQDQGFSICPPFGDYFDDPNSICMEKRLG